MAKTTREKITNKTISKKANSEIIISILKKHNLDNIKNIVEKKIK